MTQFMYYMSTTQNILYVNSYLLRNNMSLTCYSKVPYGHAYKVTLTSLCGYFQKQTHLIWDLFYEVNHSLALVQQVV
jgi:hypothetical protein